jgi:hypothetical protein
MATKLTLSIDENIVAEAKEYAKESGKSLSKIIEGYLKGLKSKKKTGRQDELPPILKRLHGCIKTDDTRDYKDIYREAMMDKYNKL